MKLARIIRILEPADSPVPLMLVHRFFCSFLVLSKGLGFMLTPAFRYKVKDMGSHPKRPFVPKLCLFLEGTNKGLLQSYSAA